MRNKYSNQNQRKFIADLGGVMSEFRNHVLKITLRELSDKTGAPIPTLNSFELGRSSSSRFIYLYLVSCETEQQINIFYNVIEQLLRYEQGRTK